MRKGGLMYLCSAKKEYLSIARSHSVPGSIIRNFKEITKVRLSVSVVFSSVAGYLLGAETIDYYILLLLCIGGYCMVGASNVFNQIIERDLDALMDRTKDRPLPAGRMGVTPAFYLGKYTYSYRNCSIVCDQSTNCNVWGNFNLHVREFIYSAKDTHTSICFCRGFSRSNSLYAGMGGCN